MTASKDFHKVEKNLPPTVFTLFGATGDLSAEYLLPAILHMDEFEMLPKDFHLVCVGRRDLDSRSYLDFICEKSKKLKSLSANRKKSILKWLSYFQGDFETPESFASLSQALQDKVGSKTHKCYNRLFYFATSPQHFADIARILKKNGLLNSCSEHTRKVRVLVEKPFGFNLKSAQSLNSLLLKYFSEEQIYRIDHYVGKETVQNLMVARFANSIFEPLWNSRYIDHLEISVLYQDGVGRRVEYYDQTGAIRDVVQNHALQMMALILMDEPKVLTEHEIRNEKYKILSSIKPATASSVKDDMVLGQYESYSKEVGQKTRTETFAAIKLWLDTPRWKDMPVYIRTGKSLHKTVTEISVHFKHLPKCLFQGCEHNVLTFRIQPNESVNLQINNKMPGFGINLHQSDLEFTYISKFKQEIPGAYERLLLDFIQGDQRLFIRSDEIEAAWQYVDSVLKFSKRAPVYKYKEKTQGPQEAEEWIQRQGRLWRTK